MVSRYVHVSRSNFCCYHVSCINWHLTPSFKTLITFFSTKFEDVLKECFKLYSIMKVVAKMEIWSLIKDYLSDSDKAQYTITKFINVNWAFYSQIKIIKGV